MKPSEKRRLVKLLIVFAAVLGLAGVVRPWSPRPRSAPIVAAEAPDAPNVLPTVHDDGRRGIQLLQAFLAARNRKPISAPPRDPFFLPEETSSGVTLIARWKAEDEQAEAALAAALAPSPQETNPTPPLVEEIPPEAVARLKALRLLGTVGGPRTPGGGAAVVEGLGRIAVGETVAGSPFRLASIGPGSARFVAGETTIELFTPKPQGGAAKSEKE
jgi:hypothetical protein